MKLELLDEDKELQNESDQLQMWKKGLEDQILDLKKDCSNALKEFEQIWKWRYKIEEQIHLLGIGLLNVQPSPRCELHYDPQPVQDDKDQKECAGSSFSSNKTAKDETSHRAFLFGSDEKSSTFAFKFCKEVPNIEFTFKKADESVEKSSSKPVETSEEIQKGSENNNGSPNGNTKDESNKACHGSAGGGDSANKSENMIAPPALNSDTNLMSEKPNNDNNWKNKINLEIALIKENILQLKRLIKESSKWRNNIENKVHELSSLRRVCKVNDETQFEKLNNKIDEHYLKMNESILDIKLSQMSRNELISRLNDVKEIVGDRFNQLELSLSEVKQHVIMSNVSETIEHNKNDCTSEKCSSNEGMENTECKVENGKENMDSLHECTECTGDAAVETSFYSLSPMEEEKVVSDQDTRKSSCDESAKMSLPLLELTEKDKVVSDQDPRKSSLDENTFVFV